MQIHDLIQTIDTMSDEQLLERVRAMRHRREVIRPASKAIAGKAVKKAAQAKVGKTDKLLGQLSEAERLAIIAMLSEE